MPTSKKRIKKSRITKYPKSFKPTREQKAELAKLMNSTDSERTLERTKHDVLGKNDSIA